MEWKKSSQNIYLQLFCFAMFVIDLIAGINYLYERNSNAFFNVGMSFVWLFAALKGRNIWVDRLGWITVNFLAVKWPEPESSLRAIMVEPSYDAALPTRMVVQAIGFPSIFYNVPLL